MSSILKVDQLQDSGGNNLVTSNGSGVITSSAFGKVLQVVRNSSTTTVSTSSTNLSELINASITPSSTSNKILILVNVMMQTTAGSNSYSGVTTIRGAFGSGTSLQEYYFGSASGGNSNELYSINTIDEPSTTSSQQYTIAIRKSSSATTSVSTDGGLYEIILMEIQG